MVNQNQGPHCPTPSSPQDNGHVWMVCGCHNNQRATAAFSLQRPEPTPTMLPASYTVNCPILHTSSSSTTNTRCSEQVRGVRATLRGGNEQSSRMGKEEDRLCKVRASFTYLFSEQKEVDLERWSFLWTVANHISLFLVPLCFDICSSLLVGFQPQAQDTRR